MDFEIEVYIENVKLGDISFNTIAGSNFETLTNFLGFIQKSFPVTGSVSDNFRYVDFEGDEIVVRNNENFLTFLRHVLEIKETIKLDKIAIYFDRNNIDSNLSLSVEPFSELISTHNYSECSHTLCVDPIADIMGESSMNLNDLKHLSILGQGSFGTVFKALNVSTDKLVALKCIPLDVSKEIQKQILTELSILHKCHSAYIVEFYGASFNDGQILMSLEFMDGGSLKNYGKIEEKLLTYVAVSVVRGLLYLWSLKIMHRDIKPSNILINSHGSIKLCDFGVSTQLEKSIAKTYVGTNAYMAPERILGAEYRVQSDVWSFGVSLMEMALGVFPFFINNIDPMSNANPMDLMQRILSKDLPKLCQQDFSVDFCHFVNSCVQSEPGQRPDLESLSQFPLIISNTEIDCNYIVNWLKSRMMK